MLYELRDEAGYQIPRIKRDRIRSCFLWQLLQYTVAAAFAATTLIQISLQILMNCLTIGSSHPSLRVTAETRKFSSTGILVSTNWSRSERYSIAASGTIDKTLEDRTSSMQALRLSNEYFGNSCCSTKLCVAYGSFFRNMGSILTTAHSNANAASSVGSMSRTG